MDIGLYTVKVYGNWKERTCPWNLYWYGLGVNLDDFGMYVAPYTFLVDNNYNHVTSSIDLEFLKL